MCGIVGMLDSGRTEGEWRQTLDAMTGRLVHRGPDGEGIWYDPEGGIGLGHRRLAVIDLSASGAQPMVSPSGRYRLTYNGELYNYRTIGEELRSRGHRFRGTSDTEVLLAAIEEWGVDLAVRRFNGMYAFGVWDRDRRELSLVRDRFGIKPLYYGRVGSARVFASELKALEAHPAFAAPLNRGAITAMMRLGVIPEPLSVYEGVRKQSRGTILTFHADRPGADPVETTYWDMARVAESAADQRFAGTEEEAAEELHGRLREAVAMRMQADVPVGAFLSGGVDSSAIVALMQEQDSSPVHTFTIEMGDPEFDESAYAREVANRLGTHHTSIPIRPEEALALVPTLARVYDEPFADSSQLPTLLVSRIARQSVTVVLVGDGADELFGGYSRHAHLLRLYGRARLPLELLGLASRAGSRGRTEKGFARSPRRAPWWSPALRGYAPADAILRRVSMWNQPERVVLGASEPLTTVTDCGRWPRLPDFAEQMMYLDAASYLPDDLLVKLDRASMSVSLEARVPFLDHEVAEFAWSLPLRYRLTPKENKRVLRRVLGSYLSPSLFQRPKRGFSIPLASWLRGPLRDWAEALLSESRLREGGLFDPAPVRARWKAHQTGDFDYRNALWAVLMVQSWLERAP